jgi:short-subunit dehydrogenase involved in D-alanine esterification of teichoic acids
LKRRNIQLDWVVASAAVGVDFGKTIPTPELASKTLHTNVTSTIDYIKQFIPILSSTGRVVIVSAMMGGLKFQKK